MRILSLDSKMELSRALPRGFRGEERWTSVLRHVSLDSWGVRPSFSLFHSTFTSIKFEL